MMRYFIGTLDIMNLHNFKTFITSTVILYSPGFTRPRITRRRP